MTIWPTAISDEGLWMTRAADVLASSGRGERYQSICQALREGNLQQAQYRFLLIEQDPSSAIGHFLTAFFLFCRGHLYRAGQEAVRACQCGDCYSSLRQFCEAIKAAVMREQVNEGEQANPNTSNESAGKISWCDGGACAEGSCDCCSCLCEASSCGS